MGPRTPVDRFAGKVALVTGAAGGLGAAAAHAFARAGAAVAACDLDADGVEGVAAAIRSDGGEAVAISCDVSSSSAVAAAVESVRATLGGLHAVATCAGLVRHGLAPDFDESDWDLVIDTNLKGTFLTAKHTLPLLRASGGGAIVTVSSVNAVASARMIPAYAASKGGIVSLSRTLALDHAAEGIRVNCILPGSVDTPMLRASARRRSPEDPDEALRAWGERHPIGHVLSPESVANVILFLASDAAEAMTGAVVAVDGGLTALLPL